MLTWVNFEEAEEIMNDYLYSFFPEEYSLTCNVLE